MIFRFEPILNLKRHLEENCHYRLKEEEVRLFQIREEILSLQKTASQQQKVIESLGVGRVDPAILASGSDFLAFIRRRRSEAEGRRLLQEEQVDTARTRLVLARQEKKTLEKLKEDFIDQESQKAIGREQKQLDEVGISQFHRDER